MESVELKRSPIDHKSHAVPLVLGQLPFGASLPGGHGQKGALQKWMVCLTSGEVPLDPRPVLGLERGYSSSPHPRLRLHSLPLGVPWEGRGLLLHILSCPNSPPRVCQPLSSTCSVPGAQSTKLTSLVPPPWGLQQLAGDDPTHVGAECPAGTCPPARFQGQPCPFESHEKPRTG